MITIDLFIKIFGSTFFSIMKLFIVVLAAGILMRRKVLSQENLQGLSVATIDVFLPCLSFTSNLSNFRPGQFDIWWVLPVTGILITAVGMLFGWLFFFRELPEKRNMLPLAGVQNASFLILPLGAILFPDKFAQFSVYVFLFVTGQSIMLWTLGKHFTTAAPDMPLRWKDMLNPPLIATLLAITLVYTGLYPFFFIPDPAQPVGFLNSSLNAVFEAMHLIGQATVPLTMFILGGLLGSISIKIRPYLWDAIRVTTIKLVILPVLTIIVVYFSGIGQKYPLLAVFFVIESASASAITLALQVKKYGGDEQKIGSILMVSYISCLLLMPVWVSVWSIISPVKV
jgi:predicted permease